MHAKNAARWRIVVAVSDTLSAIMSTARTAGRTPAVYVGLVETPSHATRALRTAFLGPHRSRTRERRQLVRPSRRWMDTATLTLVDSRMSSRHARLTRVGTTWVVDDLRSKNGTWVGGEPVTRQRLEDGDVIVLGHTALVYRAAGGELADHDGSVDATSPVLTTMSTVLASGCPASRRRRRRRCRS